MRAHRYPARWLLCTAWLAPALTMGAPQAAEPSTSPPPESPPTAQIEAGRTERPRVSLHEALARSLQTSPDVAATRAQVALARVAVYRAWSAWKPNLSANARLVYTTAPALLDQRTSLLAVGDLFNLPAPDAAALAALPGAVTIVAPWSRYATLELAQPLFSPEGLLLIAPAKAGADAGELSANEAREQILLTVAQTYLTLQGVEHILEASRRAEGVALRRERDARVRIDIGSGVELDLLRARTELAATRSQIAQLEGQRIQLLELLGAVVGTPIAPLRELRTERTLVRSASEAEAPWEKTFQVRSARKQLEAAEGVLRYDNFAWLPSLAAVATGLYDSNAGFSGTNTVGNLSLVANLPLYDAGLRYAARRESRARRDQARAGLESALARSRANWQSARANVQVAEATLAQAEAQDALARRTQEQVEIAVKAGVATSLDLQDADARALTAAQSVAQARAALETRRMERVYAESGLFEAVTGSRGTTPEAPEPDSR